MVGIKRVVDYNVRVRAKPDGSGMATEGLKMSLNPFDEIAIEAALRLKETGAFAQVLLVTIGPAEAEQQLRTGLAMGADRAIRVAASAELEPLTVARALHALALREQPGLVVLGNDQHSVHERTPRATSTATSSVTSLTRIPATRVGGGAKCCAVNCRSTATPSSASGTTASGLLLALRISGNFT